MLCNRRNPTQNYYSELFLPPALRRRRRSLSLPAPSLSHPITNPQPSSQMLSATIAAHPAAAITLRQRHSLRPLQPLRVPIGAAPPRRRMATARPLVVKALASQGVPAVPPKLSFPILVPLLGLVLCWLRVDGSVMFH